MQNLARRLRRHRLVLILSIPLLLGGGVAFAATQHDDRDCSGRLPSATRWSAGGDAQTDEAYRLVDCGRLIGLKTTDVERLLGAPRERDSDGTSYELGE